MNMMPAGEYYVGDLCYVLSNRWDEFCALTIDGHNVKNGVFTMADGTTFATFTTAYGDGVYMDEQGNEYPVDAGLIGCVLVSHIDESDPANVLGQIRYFDRDFQVYSDGKVITFGDISIDTDPEPEYDDEDDYYDYDDEDEE